MLRCCRRRITKNRARDCSIHLGDDPRPIPRFRAQTTSYGILPNVVHFDRQLFGRVRMTGAHANDQASKGTTRYAIAASFDKILLNRAMLSPTVQRSTVSPASRDRPQCECETTHRAQRSSEPRDTIEMETRDRSHRDCEAWIQPFKADREWWIDRSAVDGEVPPKAH